MKIICMYLSANINKNSKNPIDVSHGDAKTRNRFRKKCNKNNTEFVIRSEIKKIICGRRQMRDNSLKFTKASFRSCWESEVTAVIIFIFLGEGVVIDFQKRQRVVLAEIKLLSSVLKSIVYLYYFLICSY